MSWGLIKGDKKMGLYKRKDSIKWWMSFTDEAGNYRQMSTETADKKQAEKIFHKVSALVGDEKFLDRDKARHYTFEDLFTKFLLTRYPLHFAEAVRTFGEDSGKLFDIIALAKKLARKNKQYPPRLYWNDLSSIKSLSLSFSGLTLNQINPENISKFRDEQLAKTKGSSKQTVLHKMNCLNHAFELARLEWKWIRCNPCEGVKKPKPVTCIKRILSEREEEPKLLKVGEGYLGGQMKEICLCGLLTGLREGDILDLKDVKITINEEEKQISAIQGKTGVPILIPLDLYPNDSRLLDMFSAKKQVVNINGYIFTYKGRKIKASHFQNEFADARKEAGIDPEFKFKYLRRTFATRLWEKGVDIYTISMLLGHTDVKTTQRYIGVTASMLRNNVRERLLDRKQVVNG
jgi:site-specific recombinase XerD